MSKAWMLAGVSILMAGAAQASEFQKFDSIEEFPVQIHCVGNHPRIPHKVTLDVGLSLTQHVAAFKHDLGVSEYPLTGWYGNDKGHFLYGSSTFKFETSESNFGMKQIKIEASKIVHYRLSREDGFVLKLEESGDGYVIKLFGYDEKIHSVAWVDSDFDPSANPKAGAGWKCQVTGL